VARFLGELEGHRVLVLGDGSNDPLVGESLAGPGEGMAGGEFAGDALVESGGAEGLDEVEVPDGEAGAGPGNDLTEEFLPGSGEQGRSGPESAHELASLG
jgi:hypothetical protein